ncbi:MAG: hypothetical protein EON58_21740 [Alphaproteobacteria bacterium]|nr:MAG: hypothetical protein EON58_21740 [Alphaproteobacteria bacterium]
MPTPKAPSRPSAPKKQVSPTVSTLASGVLAGRIKPTPKQIASLAGAALSNDETPGQGRRR